MAKNFLRQTYPPCEICRKRITQRKDVGKALELIYVPKGPDTMKKPMMTQMMKENPRSLITPKPPPQAILLPKSLSQKPNFGTTPNT